MTSPEVLSGLRERAKAASGPDRQLDVDIAWAIEPERYATAYWNGRTGKPGTTLPKKLDGLGLSAVRHNCPSFTASIDAALALVERKTPGKWWLTLTEATDRLWNSPRREDGLKMLPIFIIIVMLERVIEGGEE